MILEEFLSWHDSIKAQIGIVTKLMVIPLHDEPENMIKQLEQVEAWNVRVGFLLAESNGLLDRAGFDLRPEKGEMSEGHLKAATEAATSVVRVVRDKLESLANCLKQRLILGESLLAYHRQFHEMKGKEQVYG
jgi:hypothetical protein